MSEAPAIHFSREPGLVHQQADMLGGASIRVPFEGRAYNPGLVRLPVLTCGQLDGATYLMCVRVQPVEHAKVFTASRLELVGLTESFEVVWRRPLSVPDMNQEGTPTAEDGRLVLAQPWFGEVSGLTGSYPMRLMCAYTQARFVDTSVIKRLTFKQALVRVDIAPSHPEAPSPLCSALKIAPVDLQPYFRNSHATHHNEKNWQFFWHHGQGYFIYSFTPFVVHPLNRGIKETRKDYDSLKWWDMTWGEPHGGTPPVRLPNGEFLTFFNSFVQHPRYQRRYVVGALTFRMVEGRAEVSRITSQPLLIGTEREGFLWTSRAYWEPLVTFATGCTLERGTIILAVGVNDCWSHIIKLPVEEVLRRMTPVK